jgi:membrane protein
LSWLTILLGALIAASLSHWRGSSARHVSPAMQLYYALHILKQMSEGMSNGAVQTVPALSGRLNVGFDSLEEILEKLAQADVVRKLAGNGWAMIRDAEHVELIELYRRFVFDPSALVEQDQGEGAEIRAWLAQLDQRVADGAAVTLHDLYAGAAHGS